MTTYTLLLSLHIAAGHLVLVAAAAALVAPKGGRWHARAGRAFTIGMAAVFATAVPMTVIRPNLFLVLVAIFSFYLALTGWLRAWNRSGRPLPAERLAASVMALTALVMLARGGVVVAGGQSMGMVLIVFGAIGGALAGRDLLAAPGDRYRGAGRIAGHLTRMLAGTIAAVTAFAVVNLRVDPPVVVWLAPTVLFTPIIVYWNIRMRRSHAPRALTPEPTMQRVSQPFRAPAPPAQSESWGEAARSTPPGVRRASEGGRSPPPS